VEILFLLQKMTERVIGSYMFKLSDDDLFGNLSLGVGYLRDEEKFEVTGAAFSALCGLCGGRSGG
jgi:hypothetical protein